MPHREADWEQALRHVRETEPLVAEQEARIGKLRAQGLPTEAAKTYCSSFKQPWT